MQRLALMVVSLVVVGGCHQDNPESCELPSNAGNGVCPGIDAAIDVPPPPPPPECAINSECVTDPNKGVCDTAINGGTCVQCTATSATACKDKTPVCTNDICVPCTRHTDCASNVCMPDGKCADENDVAYVNGGGTDQMMCTKMTACTKIEKAAMAKNIVKIEGTVTERATLNNRKDLVILADDDAKLTPMQDGAALDIRGESDIQIYDLHISHLPGGNPKTGISVSDNAKVELIRVSLISNTADGAQIDNNAHLICTRCTIAQNASRGINMSNGELTISRSEIKSNANGGIFVPGDGKFQIVANIIFGNGGMSSQAGGIYIGNSQGDGTSRIDFNSVSRNNANTAFAPGLHCVSTGTQLTAKLNVVWDNGTSPFSGNQVNPGGCAHVSSDIGPLPAPSPASNFNTDPGFRDEANGDLRLKSDSSVLHKVDVSDLTGLAALDIDGEMRVSPVDLGADQLPRP